MKYIKSINEMVKNHKLVKYYFEKMKKELENIGIKYISIFTDNKDYHQINFTNIKKMI
jgi:hypothetical protein